MGERSSLFVPTDDQQEDDALWSPDPDWGFSRTFRAQHMWKQEATSLGSGLESFFSHRGAPCWKNLLHRPPVIISSHLFELLSTESAGEPQNRVKVSWEMNLQEIFRTLSTADQALVLVAWLALRTLSSSWLDKMPAITIGPDGSSYAKRERRENL